LKAVLSLFDDGQKHMIQTLHFLTSC